MIDSNRSAPSIAHADQRKLARQPSAGAIRWLARLVCSAAVTLLAACAGSPSSDFGASPLWTYANPTDEAEHHAYYSLIGVAGERLIVQISPHAGDYHAMMALDRRSGAELWRTPIISDQAMEILRVTPSLLNDRRLFVSTAPFQSSQRTFLLAIDLVDDRLLWQQAGFRPASDGYLDGAAEPLFVTEAETGHLVGLDSETGAVRVRTEIPARRSLIADGIVYGEGPEGGLFAVNGGNGALLWQIETGELADAQSFADGRLFYRTRGDGRLAALDAATGRELWARPDVWWYAVAGDSVAVVEGEGADLAVLAVATGEIRQRLPLFVSEEDNDAHPVVSDGVLYQASGERLAAFDLRSGDLLWESALPVAVDWIEAHDGHAWFDLREPGEGAARNPRIPHDGFIAVDDAFYATFYESHPSSPGSPFRSSNWYFAVGDLRTGAIQQWTLHDWDQTMTDGNYIYLADFNAATVRAVTP